jgi:transcription initiation factor TFIID subunit TAF12
MSGISVERIKEIVETEMMDEIDDDAAQLIASMAEDVLISLISGAATIAENRYSQEIEIKDLQYIAEHNWNIKL